MINNQIKISVVMSVYNAEKYLISSIESIINQSYKNLEFIIVNDGSTDNSLQLINKYALKDNRIIVLSHKNIGLTRSLNVAIKKATGHFIARMDADDISLQNRLQNFINYINKNNDVDIYSTPAILMNSEIKTLRLIPNYFRRNGFDSKMLNFYNSLIHGTLIIKSDLIKKYKYDESFRFSQDFELYHRLLNKGFKINLDKHNISYKLRIHKGQVTNLFGLEQNKCFRKVFAMYNKKYYENNRVNKILFILIDFFYYVKLKTRLG